MHINTSILLVHYYPNLDFHLKLLLQSINQNEKQLKSSITIKMNYFPYSIVISSLRIAGLAWCEFLPLHEMPMDKRTMWNRESYRKMANRALLFAKYFLIQWGATGYSQKHTQIIWFSFMYNFIPFSKLE